VTVNAGAPAQRMVFSTIDSVGINAWTGSEQPSSALGHGRDGWAMGSSALLGKRSAAPRPPNAQNWQDPAIGWGLILPERPGLSPAQLAGAGDAPEPLQALLAARPASKVLRYRPGNTYSDWVLNDYAGNSSPPIATAPEGIGPGCIPGYLLIAASPAEVPWLVQYELNPVRRVGRLDLPPDGLANYVTALMSGWNGCETNYDSPVVWAVDFGGGDITSLMRDSVAAPLAAKYAADTDMTATTFIDGRSAATSGAATAASLVSALANHRPSVVVTSSHGQTGPLDEPDEMRARLGALVDADHATLEAAQLLAAWEPAGAVWFAQACCSAGAESPSLYTGLFETTSAVGRVLDAVASLGACTAPLPTALLGAPKPLRAFIGHVEPTFDWTLVFPPTKQQITSSTVNLMYDRVCSGRPVGLALNEAGVYAPVAALLLGHDKAVSQYAGAGQPALRRTALDLALYSKVTAYDRSSLVLLGDPTVAIPVPPHP
jgi:hypothetical protein